MSAAQRQVSCNSLLAVIAIIVVTALSLWLMGRVPICKCGYVKLWEGVVASPGNSQHIFDWYSPSHVIHGFIFYGLLWLVARRWSIGIRLVIATIVKAAWEIFENTPFIINRYREATISLDYYGDRVLNSSVDILALNIIMLLWPLDAIRQWQMGG